VDTSNPLDDPAFVAYLESYYQGPIEPDKQDLDPTARRRTDKECAEQWRLAQGRKLARIFHEWKALQN
jgi:hypothetical protein